MIEYDDRTVCTICGGLNVIIVKDSMNGIVLEAETKCIDCGNEDY